MADSNPDKTEEAETPYALEVAEAQKLALVSSMSSEFGENHVGFYVTKNLFARKNYNAFPEKGYKPVLLSDVNDGLWKEFDREVQHYHKYYTRISWYYKMLIVFPTLWFLFMVLPDLLYFYEIPKGVGAACGLVLALAFAIDTHYQRRLLRRKVHPMFAQLIEVFKPRFLLHGFVISYELERTPLEGMNSVVILRKSTGRGCDIFKGNGPSEMGFYLDEDVLGKKPYALDMASRTNPPRFLQGFDADTWANFAKDVYEKSPTPTWYLWKYSLGMGLLVGLFVFVLIYSVVFLAEVRHWLLIVLLPLYELAKVMKSFRRRHYVENVLYQEMTEIVQKYEWRFHSAGFGISYELEYALGYFLLDSYFNFWKLDPDTPPPITGVKGGPLPTAGGAMVRGPSTLV